MPVNRVMLCGRLGRAPEVKYTGSGKAVATLSVATDDTFKNKSGEREKKTEWHKVVVWDKQAEIAGKYLQKGSLIFVEGRLQTREWEKDGEKRSVVEVVAERFRMLDGAKVEESFQKLDEADAEKKKNKPRKFSNTSAGEIPF
jgi:single-strand DNA-binding protein